MYRVSVDVTLVLATLVLSMDVSADYPLARYYPLGVAVAAVASYLLIDRHPGVGIGRGVANVLAFGVSIVAILEWYFDPDSLVVALGHWLVYLMVVKMFLPKTVEDDWFLLLLTLVQVLIGATLSQSDAVGMALFAWAVSALWVLGLFYLHREAIRARGDDRRPPVPGGGDAEPYPGLIGLSYLLATLRGAAVTMALGGLIFLVMPRRAVNERVEPRAGGPPRHMTGFTDTVRLGQFGEILENDTIVMSIELLDEAEDPIDMVGEPLWRGVALIQYENKRWHREVIDKGIKASFLKPVGARTLRYQRIKLEPTDNHILFAMRPVIEASGTRHSHIEFNTRDGSLYRDELVPRLQYDYELANSPRPGPFDYKVMSAVSEVGETSVQAAENYPNANRGQALLQVPEALKARLVEISDPVVAGIKEDDPIARAKALDRWLNASGQFHYSLRLNVIDRTIDPVEDFLVNRKQGHCEYFASALTLMLRAQGVPARMVSGFKGGDWSQLTRVTNVRQKHAHTWVEALVGETKNHEPIWLTLDPTPGTERDESIAKVGGFAGRFRMLTDSIRYLWVFYIVGFNSERQQRVLYGPLLGLAEDAGRGFRMMGRALRAAVRWLLDFRGNLSRNLLRVSLLALVAASASWLLARILRRAARRLFSRWVGAGADPSGMAAGVAFYRRASQLLAEYGLERPPSETPREFALRASTFLRGRGAGAEGVADVPPMVVDAFYRIRFGRLDPGPDDLKRLETRLDALEAHLRGSVATA